MVFVMLAAVALLQGCGGEPVPTVKSAYVGDWRAQNMRLAISREGHVSYVRVDEGRKTTINLPIQRFEGDDFIVGFGPFSTRFVVSKPPRLDAGRWKMTVDGVELVRLAVPGEATA
jgi:hypothetical protein